MFSQRLSFPMATGPNSSEASGSGLTSSTNQPSLIVKKEEPGEDFTFGEPVAKKQKTSATSQGRPIKQAKSLNVFGEGLHMNWDPIQVLPYSALGSTYCRELAGEAVNSTFLLINTILKECLLRKQIVINKPNGRIY